MMVEGQPRLREGTFESLTSVTLVGREDGGQATYVVMSNSHIPELGENSPVVESIQLLRVSPTGRVTQEFTLGPDFIATDFVRLAVQASAPTKTKDDNGAIGIKFPEVEMSVYLNLDDPVDQGGTKVRRIHAPLNRIRSGPFPVDLHAAEGGIEIGELGKTLATSATLRLAISAGSPQGQVNVSTMEVTGRQIGSRQGMDEECARALVAELQASNSLKDSLNDMAENPTPEGLRDLEGKVKAHLELFPKGLLNSRLLDALAQLKDSVKRAETQRALQPGAPAPDIEGRTIDNEKFRLSDFKGSVVLVDFWATWCPPCVMEVPKVKKLFEQHKDSLIIIGISADQEIKDLRDFVTSQGIKWRQVFEPRPDMAWHSAFGVEGYPTYILINRDGSIAAVGLRGQELIDAVEKLVSGN
jgi:thiol-disulfide isomerase/thioredoxin